jgi:nucleoside-diphosphate-sugar epimerase
MRILIIGGTGLISTAITRELVERGDQVTLFNRGTSEEVTPPGVETIRGDRRDYRAFETRVAEAVHFDCVIDMVGYQPDDGESVVRAFRDRVGQFVFCSTIDVYRKPASRYPLTEAEGYGGLNAYSSNKVIIEKTLLAAQQAGGFPLTIIRPAATYGEGRSPINPLGGPNMYVDRIRKGKPIVVHGDGSSLWASCYRGDVARAFVGAIGNARAIGRAYHAAGEEWLTWDTYHQQAAAAIGAPPPTIVHIPTDLLGQVAPKRAALVVENFQFSNIFDNTAARSDLGFQPAVSWMDGVRLMVRWLDEHGRVANSDDDTFEDRLIAAWRRCGDRMAAEFSEVEGA